MLENKLLERIDKAIEDNPNENVWHTYEKVKEEIENQIQARDYYIDYKKYDKCINYIADKLRI